MLHTLLRRRAVNQRVVVLRARLFRTAFAWCHNRPVADDLVQEAITKAIENAHQLKNVDAIDTWIFSILANCHRSVLRQRSESRYDELAEIDDSDTGLLPDEASDTALAVNRVRSALTQLSSEQRKTITLIDLEGFSYAEVAQILAVPIGTVMSRLSRSRERLRKILVSPGRESSANIAYLSKRKAR